MYSFFSILLGMRDVCVNWLNGEPTDDPALKGDKDPKTGYKIDVPRKAVRPSSTQVHFRGCVCFTYICDCPLEMNRIIK